MKTLILLVSISICLSNCIEKIKAPEKTSSFNNNSKPLESEKKNTQDWFLLKTNNKCYQDINKAYLLSLFGKNEGC